MTVSAGQAVRLIEKAAERERNDRFLRDNGWAILWRCCLWLQRRC